MVWTETCAVDERMRFVIAAEKHEEAFAAICRRFGVSRRVGYKWLARYEEAGVEGLLDRSRAPLHRSQTIAEGIAERCLAVRRAHPTWGPVKVGAWLERRAPETEWPAASTIGALFDREGLTVKRKLRRRSPPSSAPFAECTAANDVWCIDFKGWFMTGDGNYCEPLTLTDAHSRYLLRCQAMARTDTEHVWPVLEAAFREFGLPHRLRSDNGPPFASRGAGGLSQLSTPAEHYTVSLRRFDGVLREPGYGSDQIVRRVRQNGEIKWNGNTIYISEALVGEPVGLTENADACTVSYGPIVLGTITHRSDRLRKPKRGGCGLVDNAARCPQGPQPQQQQT